MKPLILLLALAAVPRPDADAPRSEHTDPAPPREHRVALGGRIAIERTHDDNILHLAQRDLDRLATGPTPPRFRVTTADDDIQSFHGEVRARLRWLRRRETRLGAALDADRYETNAVKDWQEYRFDASQELTASRRSLMTLSGWVSRLPRYYLGEITDQDDSFAAGTRIRRSLTFAQTEAGALLEQRFLKGRLELGAGGLRRRRDYDSHFDERDNTNVEWRVEGTVRPLRFWGLALGIDWRGGRLAARGDLASTLIRDADISYDHHGLGVSIDAPWEIFGRRGRASWDYQPETRRYTTADKFDLTRFERTNARRDQSVVVSQTLAGPLEAALRWSRLTSDASFPDGERFPDDRTDFVQNRFGVTLRARWP